MVLHEHALQQTGARRLVRRFFQKALHLNRGVILRIDARLARPLKTREELMLGLCGAET